VRVAEGAFWALREFKRFRPTTVLVDIGLPLINGYQLAKRLRERGNCGLIAVSSWPPPTDGSHTTYFERYLMKPVDIGSLREALTAVGRKYS
jgi:DNA-binding response OmpR family regulator